MIKLKYLLERVSKTTDDKKVETKPSQAQIEAGNYKKGHIRRDGLDITIENKKGSTRSGIDDKGNKWSVKMNNDYGYIKGTVGKDKDHLDCFLNPNYKEGLSVYIVNQTIGNKFDEHKVMLGFKNKFDAKKAYTSNYNRGQAHFSDIVKMSMDDFKKWITKKSLTKKPAKIKEDIIKLKNLILEFDDDVVYNVYDLSNNIMYELFNDFLYNNNDQMNKNVPWNVINFNELKSTWEYFMNYGHVRNEGKLDDMSDIVIKNCCKIYIFTTLCGHTSSDPDDSYHDAFDDYIDNYLKYYKYKKIPHDKNQLSFKFYKKIKVNKINNKYLDTYMEENQISELPLSEQKHQLFKELQDKFLEYYVEDPESGQAYISDFALDKLMDLTFKLYREKKPENKVVIIDQILNVVHQRSDIAGWFVQGGSKSLSTLSGYGNEDSKLGNND